MHVEQEPQKTYCDQSKHEPSYKIVEEGLVFNPTVKKGETRKFTFFYRGQNIIFEIINDLNFKVEDKKSRKTVMVHNDRLKNIKHGKSHSRLSLRRNEKQPLRSRRIAI